MREDIKRIVLADNPWLAGQPTDPWYKSHLPKRYLPRLAEIQGGDKACLVVGPRQAGKSTLIWRHLADAGAPALFLNCEESGIHHWLSSPAAFLSDLTEVWKTPVPLFFEEIQHLEDAGLFLKGLVDRPPGVPILATGSSSFDLAARTRESLAGRATRLLLLPLTIEEAGPEVLQSPLARQESATRLQSRLLIFGGYPTVLLADQPDRELAGLVEALVLRDASDRLRVRHPAAFRQVLQLAASQIGNLVNFSEWSSLASVSNDTVSQYVDLLEQFHVVKLVRPFAGGKRVELTARPKVYLVDNGVRNMLFGGFTPAAERADRGALLENLVFGEILKRINPLLDSVRYWRTRAGAEVDFVVEHQGKLLAVEVKWGDLRGRAPRGLAGFIETYRPEAALVVHGGERRQIEIAGRPVHFVAAHEMAGHLQNFLSA